MNTTQKNIFAVDKVILLRKSNFNCIYQLILGNGPSGITLSYLLSGNVPYYRGNSSDEFLHLRLTENADEPLVLQDLAFLSDVSMLTPTDLVQGFCSRIKS